jgi:hypothetical protein
LAESFAFRCAAQRVSYDKRHRVKFFLSQTFQLSHENFPNKAANNFDCHRVPQRSVDDTFEDNLECH